MKVILAIEAHSHPHSICIDDEMCHVVVPMFDYWTNTETFSFPGLGASSKVAGEHLAVEIPDRDTRSYFHTSLTEAFGKAREGYTTMSP